MYLKIVCLNELNRNHFYLLPLRLLLLPLNKNCFSNIVGFCVYIINTIIHGCLEIWNFSSRVQFDISLVRYAHSWDIALNTRREIPYLRAPMYYCLFSEWLQSTDLKFTFWVNTVIASCVTVGSWHWRPLQYSISHFRRLQPRILRAPPIAKHPIFFI